MTMRFHILASTALIASGVASSAYAADKAPGGFSAETRGTETLSYDSNPLRTVTGSQDLFGSTTSPQLILRYKTPLSEIEADTKVDANYYNHSAFNSVDLHEKLTLSRSNERWTASVRGLIDYDTTRSSEITNYGLNIPKVRSTRLSAAPQILFRQDERNSWKLDAKVEDTTYNNNAYTDYSIYSISPSYEHSFDRYNKGQISVRAQHYQTNSGVDQQSDSFGPTLGWTAIFSDKLSAHAEAGIQSIEKSGANQAGTDGVNYVFSGNVKYHGVQDDLSLNASRALQPFGNGTETLLTSFGVRERHAINEKFSLNANAVYQLADYDKPPGVNLDHGYTLGGGMAYKIIETVDLNADYRFRSEDLTNAGTVDEHVVMLGLTLHPAWSQN